MLYPDYYHCHQERDLSSDEKSGGARKTSIVGQNFAADSGADIHPLVAGMSSSIQIKLKVCTIFILQVLKYKLRGVTSIRDPTVRREVLAYRSCRFECYQLQLPVTRPCSRDFPLDLLGLLDTRGLNIAFYL